MSVGQVIKKRRAEVKLTQDEVAEKVGISKPYLSNIETGKCKNPPLDPVLLGLERTLGFEPGFLLRMAHLQRTPKDVRKAHEELMTEVEELRQALKDMAAGKKVSPPGKGKKARTKIVEAEDKDRPADNIRQLAGGVIVPIINKVAAGYPQVFTDLDYPPSIADEYVRCPDVHDEHAFAARVVGDSMEPEYRENDIVVFSPSAVPRNGNDCFIRFEGGEGTTFKRMYQDSEQTIRLQPLNSKYAAITYPLEKITGVWPAVYRMEKLR